DSPVEKREEERQGEDRADVQPRVVQAERRAHGGYRNEERRSGRKVASREHPAPDEEQELLGEQAQMEQGNEVRARHRRSGDHQDRLEQAGLAEEGPAAVAS